MTNIVGHLKLIIDSFRWAIKRPEVCCLYFSLTAGSNFQLNSTLCPTNKLGIALYIDICTYRAIKTFVNCGRHMHLMAKHTLTRTNSG